MEDCVSPGDAHAVGHSPRRLAQVVLYSICPIICSVKMQIHVCDAGSSKTARQHITGHASWPSQAFVL